VFYRKRKKKEIKSLDHSNNDMFMLMCLALQKLGAGWLTGSSDWTAAVAAIFIC
jgi:hypothetical protein